MTTRRSTTIRSLAALLALLVPLAGCDWRGVQTLATGRAERADREGRPYVGLLDTEGGRALALARLNDGEPTPRNPRVDATVERSALHARRFADEEAGALAGAPSRDGRAPRRDAPPFSASTLVAAMPPAVLADPALTPALLALLSGQPAQGFVAFTKPEPEGGPALFTPESPAGLSLTMLPGSRSPWTPPVDPQAGPGGFQVMPTPPPPPNHGIDGYSSGTTHLLRYACCDELVVRADASAGAPVVATLDQGELVWLLDLTPSTGLQGAVAGLDECQENGDCHSVVAEIASHSAIDYQAEIFVPALGVAGFVDFAALFVRPVGAAQGSLLLETGYDRIASALEQGLDAAFQGGTCSDAANSVTVNAGFQDRYYDPTSQADTTCDAALACPDWKIVSCEGLTSDDEGFSACRYTSLAQCGGPAPAGAASASKSACVRNVCPGKGTCGACREWFAATGQDVSGWQTEWQLVDQCIADLYAQQDDDDIPVQCLGDPSCVDYCQFAMQTWNVGACTRYIAPHDSRSFADPTDYECGEVPIAETHPNFWYYANLGEWSGQPDSYWKELESFSLFGKHHVFEMGRLDYQTPISFSTPDLTDHGASHVEHLGRELTARNVWLSLAPTTADDDVFGWLDGDERSALALNVCAHVPGISVRGPEMDYDPTDTPFFLISHIDFGAGSVDRADLCAMGVATIDDALQPKMAWLDASLALAGIDYGGVEVNKGPGFWLLAAASKLVPVVGEILAHVVLTAVFLEELAEGLIDFTDLDSWLADFLLRVYEAKVTGKVLDQLNAETRSALADLDLDAQERLAGVCAQLDPGVSPSHPYYWFYRHLASECERVTSSAVVDPIVANATSAAKGCYGEQMLFTPDDAGQGHWWQQYMWQDWYFPFWEESGCRIGTRVEAVADPATWPVLRCATAAWNSYSNGLVFEPEDPASGLDFLKTDAAPPSDAEQFEALGPLAFMVKEACSAIGHWALEDLYGDGADVAELWKQKHGEGGFGLQGN